MRDIKFRAWEVKGEGFIAGFNMCNYHSYFNKGLTPSIFRYGTEWEDGEYILEQFTGLLDKNGGGLQEVYEGDIIGKDGILKGSIHEIQPTETDLVIPSIRGKAWIAAYKEAVGRGFDYAE